MGIFKQIREEIKYRIYKKVYCQDSGRDITLEGGWYTSYGGIYCKGINMSIFQSASLKDSKNFFVKPKNPQEIQQLIREGKLIHYKKPTSIINLEDVLTDN